MLSFIAVMIIGAAVGFVARYLYPGPNTLHGTYRSFGWIEPNRLADFINMVATATIVLFIWDRLVA